MAEDLPRQLARTNRFTAGAPHDVAVAANGRLVTFLRKGDLWVFDTQGRAERRIASAESYSVDRTAISVALVHAHLCIASLDTGELRQLPVTGARDPRLDPSESVIAYIQDRALRLVDADGTNDRALLEPDGDEVSWGSSEFVAWMSMGRDRGFCWSPDGKRLLAARVDETNVRMFHLTDPAYPDREPQRYRYPSVGTPNADVSLHIVDLDGAICPVRWDRERFEYVVRVDWSVENPLLVVQSRDQRLVHVLEVDPETGATICLREVKDAAWVTVARGAPARTASGSLVWVERDVAVDTYRLMVDNAFATPPGLQVLQIRAVDGNTITVLAQSEPTEVHVFAYDGDLRQLSQEAGVHDGWHVGGTTVLDSRTIDGPKVTVNGHVLESQAEVPAVKPRASLSAVGKRGLRTAVFRPSWYEPGSGPLPVLINSYAGPAMQVAVAGRSWHHLLSQWFAERGFIVLTIDGRGTPGRGPQFEREIVGDILGPVLQDQVDALLAVAERDGDLDLDRVAIRGWSFGGYLAAAAVLHRPETFHVAVAGAAVSDQRMYDSYWKERYLGDPRTKAEAYRRCSLLPYVTQLTRPLLIIQGLADTNVWSLHTLRLSAALLAAGKPHSVLPLPGQGHRPDGDVAANLPHLELAFIRNALGIDALSTVP